MRFQTSLQKSQISRVLAGEVDKTLDQLKETEAYKQDEEPSHNVNFDDDRLIIKSTSMDAWETTEVEVIKVAGGYKCRDVYQGKLGFIVPDDRVVSADEIIKMCQKFVDMWKAA